MLARLKLLLCVTVLLAAAPALAAVGRTWTTSGIQEFAAGKLEGVSVLSTGEIQLAPQMDKIDGVKAGIIWAVAAAADGTAYVGTGSPGAVYKVEGGKATLLCQSDQDNVLSVLPMPDGSVLAGTAPHGIILRINRQGEAQVFARLPDAYVWAMALTPTNEVMVATGPNGRLLQLDRAGQVTEKLKVKQHNLMCVAVDADGNTYAGTEPDGYIYRLPREGKATVIYDADESEVHSLVISPKGVIYAATDQGRAEARPEQPPQSGPSRPTGARAGGEDGGDSSQAGPVPAPAAMPAMPSAPNSVYRIVPGQGGMRVLRFDRMGVLSLGLMGNRLLVGTGPGGRIFSLDEDGVSRILAQVDSPHVTAIAVLPDGNAIIGTSNSAVLWSLKKDVNEKGTYYSKPFDADYLSRWANVKWQSLAGAPQGGEVRVKLRTGNSGEPDETWSDWSEWATQASGQPVTVAMGRFAQFAVQLSARPRTGSPSLVSVEISYLQANRKPVIDDIAVNGVSVLKTTQRPAGGPPGGQPMPPQPGRPAGKHTSDRMIAWKAADPNDDELTFDLYYRALDATQWLLIKKDLSDGNYAWDTSRVPDGYYQLKLVAGDKPDRPAAEALEDVRISFPLLVDNRPPDALDLKAVRLPDGSYKLTGRAVDDFSPIKEIAVSENAGDWLPVFPDDGVLDSPQEAFSFTTAVLTPGEHVFVFAVTDSNDNTGSGQIVVEVAGPAK